MDNLEKLIQENKTEFDEHQVDTSKLWKNISVELDQRKTTVKPLWKSSYFKIAAGLILILGIASIIKFNAGFPEENVDNLASKELQEIDMYYQNMVQAQIRLVEKNSKLSKSNKQEFLKFLTELDKEYDLLKLDLADNLDNELVLEAIVKNYKKRIELIENLLEQINDTKNNTDDDTYVF